MEPSSLVDQHRCKGQATTIRLCHWCISDGRRYKGDSFGCWEKAYLIDERKQTNRIILTKINGSPPGISHTIRLDVKSQNGLWIDWETSTTTTQQSVVYDRKQLVYGSDEELLCGEGIIQYLISDEADTPAPGPLWQHCQWIGICWGGWKLIYPIVAGQVNGLIGNSKCILKSFATYGQPKYKSLRQFHQLLIERSTKLSPVITPSRSTDR